MSDDWERDALINQVDSMLDACERFAWADLAWNIAEIAKEHKPETFVAAVVHLVSQRRKARSHL